MEKSERRGIGGKIECKSQKREVYEEKQSEKVREERYTMRDRAEKSEGRGVGGEI